MSSYFIAVDGTAIVLAQVASVGPVKSDGAYADCNNYYTVNFAGGGSVVIGNLSSPTPRFIRDRQELLEAVDSLRR